MGFRPRNLHPQLDYFKSIGELDALYLRLDNGNVPSSGDLAYWNRTGTLLSPINAGDSIDTTGPGTFGSSNQVVLGNDAGQQSINVTYGLGTCIIGDDTTPVGFHLTDGSKNVYMFDASTFYGLRVDDAGVGTRYVELVNPTAIVDANDGTNYARLFDGTYAFNTDANVNIGGILTVTNSIDSGNRHLIDSGGINSIDYGTKETRDASNEVSISWESRGLYNSSGNQTLEWDSGTAQGGSSTTVLNWNSLILSDDTPLSSIDWGMRKLIANDGADTVLNWATSGLADFGNSTIKTTTLIANLGVYTDGSNQLTTTAPTSGVLGYWNRTGTQLTAATAGDDILITDDLTIDSDSGGLVLGDGQDWRIYSNGELYLDRLVGGGITTDAGHLYTPATFYIGVSGSEYKLYWGSDTVLRSNNDINFIWGISSQFDAKMAKDGTFYVGQHTDATALPTGALLSAQTSLDVQRWGGVALNEMKRANGSPGSSTTVVNGNDIGFFNFGGYDGTSIVSSARAGGTVEGAVSTGVVPIGFFIATGSDTSPTTAFYVDPSQNTYIGDGGTTNYTQIGATGNLSFAGTAEFHPPRIAQSAQPTLNDGEMVIWRDTDDGKVYLIYDDADSGAVKIELT